MKGLVKSPDEMLFLQKYGVSPVFMKIWEDVVFTRWDGESVKINKEEMIRFIMNNTQEQRENIIDYGFNIKAIFEENGWDVKIKNDIYTFSKKNKLKVTF